MTKIVLIDVDDTLLDFPWQEQQAIRRTYEALGSPMTDHAIMPPLSTI